MKTVFFNAEQEFNKLFAFKLDLDLEARHNTFQKLLTNLRGSWGQELRW